MSDPRARVLYERIGPLLPSGWRDDAPWGFPDQVELALVAGVFRAQAPQATVDAVVDAFMRSRSHDLLDDLSQTAAAGVDGVIAMLGPRWGDTNVLGVPVLRAAVIHGAAAALSGLDIRSGEDLRVACDERPADVERAVLAVRGLGKGTWEWVTVQAHARLRPDAQMIRFIREQVGDGEKLDAAQTAELLRATARHFAADERAFTHAVHAYLDSRSA